MKRNISEERLTELKEIGKKMGGYTAFYKTLGELVYRNSVNDHSKDEHLNIKLEEYKKRLGIIWNLKEQVM